MKNIFLLYIIVFIINIFWVFGFFVRLVGIETKKWSTTNSIFQIINLIPRTIGILQIPLITLYTESALNKKIEVSPFFYQGIILFNLLGLLIGFIFLPFFLRILGQIINKIFEKESFRMVIQKDIWRETFQSFRKLSVKSFFLGFNPLKTDNGSLLIYNLFAAFLISVAFPACVLAGYYVPDYRATIISSVSIIYGISTFITILLIDTKLSVITDQAFHDTITLQHYKEVLFDCIKGRILGITIGIIILPYLSEIIVALIRYILS